MPDAEWFRYIISTLLMLIFGSYAYTNRALSKVWDAIDRLNRTVYDVALGITKIKDNELAHVKELEQRVIRLEAKAEE